MSRKRTPNSGLMAHAPVFAALGDETRLRIVARLCDDGPLSIVQLTEGSDISRQGVTKHLRALEKVGLLRSCRTGRERIWELETGRLTEAHRYLNEISEQWDDKLHRLRAFVETKT
jgi:DNA-binding transcriptional ArsR family regulator